MKSMLKKGALLAAAVLCANAQAYEAGDWIVRSGAVVVAPDEDSSALSLQGVGKLPGTGVKVNDDTQLLLTATYMAAPHVGVELLAATPFEHEVRTTGLAGLGLGLSDVKLASIKHLPPTLTVLWYPMDAQSKFQPFIGGGFNYTLFFDENVDKQAKTALGASGLNLDNSAGYALRAGADLMLNDHWSLHAGVYYIDIATKASVDTALGKVKVDVDVNPWVYSFGVGYKF